MATKDGDPGTIRTCDHSLRRRVLYPLSYGADFLLMAEARDGRADYRGFAGDRQDGTHERRFYHRRPSMHTTRD